MKNLRLNFDPGSILSREEMKQVLGGDMATCLTLNQTCASGNMPCCTGLTCSNGICAIAQQVYVCSCGTTGGGSTSWQYNNQPSQGNIGHDAGQAGCSASPSCTWQTCGNPGVTC